MIKTAAALPERSNPDTVAVAVDKNAALGVPLMTPVPELMLNPDGNPAAPNRLIPLPPEGFIAAIGTPTINDSGTVYVGAVGAIRSTVSERVTALGEVWLVFDALTTTLTLVPVM